MTTERTRLGSCLCGAVRFTVRGEPYKSGLCHCSDCRHITGSAFLAYADWRPDQFETTGKVSIYQGRSFCPVCGSRLFSFGENQVEIYLGALDDAPNGIAPDTEGWTFRREHWLPAISGADQFDRDPT